MQIYARSQEPGGHSLSTPRAVRDRLQQRLKLGAAPEVEVKTSL